MRVGSPVWKSVREAARCFLKSERAEVFASNESIQILDEMSIKVAELQPQKLDFPDYYITNDDNVAIHCDDVKIIISKQEPDQNCIWLPSQKLIKITDFVEMVVELAEAGYPGCVGCIGSIDEKPWNEAQSRVEMFHQ